MDTATLTISESTAEPRVSFAAFRCDTAVGAVEVTGVDHPLGGADGDGGDGANASATATAQVETAGHHHGGVA